MQGIIGIDSRPFIRRVIKRDGNDGEFKSVLGIAVRVKDYETFDKEYKEAMEFAFSSFGLKKEYRYYCINDLKDNPKIWEILNKFSEKISPHIERVHVFYCLFSRKRLPRIKIYGRLAEREQIKLSIPDINHDKFISRYITNSFPGICAWRLMEYLSPGNVQFHIDSYESHICEAEEELEKGKFTRFIFPSGDCINPIISTADLLIGLLDYRLEVKQDLLIFENIRPLFPEFGDRLLVYPILNKHLPKITPLDKVITDNTSVLKHPVYWIFKGGEDINAGTLKRSETYRNLLDVIAHKGGCAKLFDKKNDPDFIKPGDFGVFFNQSGEESIKTYRKIGKIMNPLNIDLLVVKETNKV